MSIRVAKVKLTRTNEESFRQVFRKCFTVKWAKSVPFPKDAIYEASLDGRVVGFCMVHHEPPQKMKYGPGAYMYNLCVAPEARRHGAGSAILRAVMADNAVCYAHMDQTDDPRNHKFMTALGWTRIGAIRQFYEYAIVRKNPVGPASAPLAREVDPETQSGSEAPLLECPEVHWNPRQYDAENNVIYVDA